MNCGTIVRFPGLETLSRMWCGHCTGLFMPVVFGLLIPAFRYSGETLTRESKCRVLE